MLAESWKRDVMAFPQVPSLGIEVHAFPAALARRVMQKAQKG